jgi:hypothetical protein
MEKYCKMQKSVLSQDDLALTRIGREACDYANTQQYAYDISEVGERERERERERREKRRNRESSSVNQTKESGVQRVRSVGYSEIVFSYSKSSGWRAIANHVLLICF